MSNTVYNAEELKAILANGVHEVTFTKLNGETRIMPCTLDHALLPPQQVTESTKTRALKSETLSVWCMDKQQWRSFRVANVTKINRA